MEGKILIVEDYEIGQRVLRIMLEKLGYKVIHGAAHWSEAIKLYLTYNHDIIFMDVGLPQINGLQITRFIRDLDRNKEKKPLIIGQTAYTVNAELLEECKRDGMNTVIHKPYVMSVIKKVVSGKIDEYEEECKNGGFYRCWF